MSKRVLIVDDQLIARMMIKEAATEAGWEVAGEAADGEDAVTQYQQLTPDLVTMDMVMPKMDGLVALEQILRFDPHARVIMISAVNQKPQLTRAIALGANDFIVKPFDRDRLVDMFSGMLAAEGSTE